jgi:hypothetical protein
MEILGVVSDPCPLDGVWQTQDTTIILFDILLYFQHIARVIDFGCTIEKERIVV